MVEVMKSDGNGGYIIQKGAFALIMVVIALLSCVVTVVAYGTTIKVDVEFLKSEISDTQLENQQIIEKIDQRMDSQAREIIQNQEKIIAMHDDIKEIKEDIKRLILV